MTVGCIVGRRSIIGGIVIIVIIALIRRAALYRHGAGSLYIILGSAGDVGYAAFDAGDITGAVDDCDGFIGGYPCQSRVGSVLRRKGRGELDGLARVHGSGLAVERDLGDLFIADGDITGAGFALFVLCFDYG